VVYLRAPGVFGVLAPGGELSPGDGVLYVNVVSFEPRGLLWEVLCLKRSLVVLVSCVPR
jgi:hypothetical protein